MPWENSLNDNLTWIIYADYGTQDILPHILTNAKQLNATTKTRRKGRQCLNERLHEGCKIHQQHLLLDCIVLLVIFLETTASEKPSLTETGRNGPSKCPCTPRQALSRSLLFLFCITNPHPEPPASVESVSHRQAYCHVAKFQQL
jgi:hypothetical protein